LTIPGEKKTISKKICVDSNKRTLRSEEREKDKLGKKRRQLEYFQRK
jgi:hypothetical protein